jgi:cell division protein FtsL
VLGSVLWIALFAALLAGIVFVNVAALQLNLRLDEVTRERANVRAANAALAAQLSSAAAAPQIESVARRQLGLEPAGPERTTYVELRPRAAASSGRR